MNWIIIVALVALAFFFLKFKEARHKFGFFFILILLLFLVVSAMQVYGAHKVDLNSVEGVMSAGKLYFSWLGHMVGNVVKITGNVVNQDWSFNTTGVK